MSYGELQPKVAWSVTYMYVCMSYGAMETYSPKWPGL